MLVENMASGVEVIVGAKRDYQFGTIILLGIGGTAVEIYRDTAIRMAPLSERDVRGMVNNLKARALLEGYRGSEAVNMAALVDMMLAFSDLAMTLGDRFESIDLNPVMCSGQDCIVADARIVLARA
jgi:acyl-CoA synthetase (NDP forming)